MNQQELLIQLHQYTPWELFHLQNINDTNRLTELSNPVEYSLSEVEKYCGLHQPHVPDSSDDTFSEQLFFPYDSFHEIKIIQHDRYSPAILHKHDFFELVYVYEGEFLHQISSNKFVMRTGDFCLIPPGVYHSLDVNNYSIILNILIQKNTFREIILKELKGQNMFSNLFLPYASAKSYNDYFLFHTNGDLRIQQIVLDMCLETLNQENYYLHMMRTNFLLLLGLLLRHYDINSDSLSQDKWKDNHEISILQFLEKNYANITLYKLAEEFHYSTQHMSNLIKHITNMSFTDYLLQKRMQIASTMLIHSQLKIKDVSEAVGYQSPEHFIRTFHKYYACTPSQYRNTHKIPKNHKTTEIYLTK